MNIVWCRQEIGEPCKNFKEDIFQGYLNTIPEPERIYYLLCWIPNYIPIGGELSGCVSVVDQPEGTENALDIRQHSVMWSEIVMMRSHLEGVRLVTMTEEVCNPAALRI